MNQDNLSLDIFGRTFHMKCPAAQVDKLKAAANLVNEEMQTLQSQVNGPDRIAIMAALNLAHTVLSLREVKGDQMQIVNEKLTQLKQQIDKALETTAQTSGSA